MHRRQNWDHLRYIVAVAEAGSVSQAARDLGVNHATVLRHVAAFEADAGAEVFEKSASGYSVHDDKMRIIDAAREVGTAVQAVRQIAQGARSPVRGLVRITSSSSFCQVLLPSLIATWRGQLDGLKIEILSTNLHLDFSRLQADITLRPAIRLDDDLRGVVAAKLGFGVYHAVGEPPETWLEPTGPLDRTGVARWMAEHIPAEDIVGSSDCFLVLREMAASGLGQTILPCIVADDDTRLTRRRGTLGGIQTNLWVASHADLADVPRFKTVRELLVSALGNHTGRLAGR